MLTLSTNREIKHALWAEVTLDNNHSAKIQEYLENSCDSIGWYIHSQCPVSESVYRQEQQYYYLRGLRQYYKGKDKKVERREEIMGRNLENMAMRPGQLE